MGRARRRSRPARRPTSPDGGYRSATAASRRPRAGFVGALNGLVARSSPPARHLPTVRLSSSAGSNCSGRLRRSNHHQEIADESFATEDRCRQPVARRGDHALHPGLRRRRRCGRAIDRRADRRRLGGRGHPARLHDQRRRGELPRRACLSPRRHADRYERRAHGVPGPGLRHLVAHRQRHLRHEVPLQSLSRGRDVRRDADRQPHGHPLRRRQLGGGRLADLLLDPAGATVGQGCASDASTRFH